MNTRHGITRFLSIFVTCFIVLTGSQATAREGVHGIIITIDGADYYLDGPADGPNGEKDIPGHYWTLTDETTLTGEHYNTGPMGAESWWATKTENDVLLWTVEAIIDTWTEEKANDYAEQEYVHYHELVRVSNGQLHPEKVVWLRHTAVTDFTFDGGPHPEFGSREVTEGVDSDFLPMGKNPYEPDIIVSVESEYVETFSLSENYPNPFNPETSISFTITKSGNVILEVFNIAGQKIDVLKDGYLDSGHYTLFWDASNFTAGVYFYTLKTTDFSKTRKMVFLKQCHMT